MVARDETGIDRYAARALSMPQEKRYYDANLTFEALSDWTLVVDVERDRTGAATFKLPMPVQEPLIPSRSVVGTVAWLLVTSILVGGISLVWLTLRAREGFYEKPGFSKSPSCARRMSRTREIANIAPH